MFGAFGHLLHLARVGYVLTREGVVALVPSERMPALARPGLWVARLLTRQPPDQQGHSNVIQRSELWQQMMKLVHKTKRSIT